MSNDGDPFQSRSGFGKAYKSIAPVECQAACNARDGNHVGNVAGSGVGGGQITLAGVQKVDLIALHAWGVREG